MFLRTCLTDCLTQWPYVLQPTAFQFWSSRMLTVRTSSIVRGRSLKSDSMTRAATTGSATTCSVSWRREAATRWDVTCRHAISAGTTRSTIRSPYRARPTTTGCMYPATRATLVMGSVTMMEWCSPRMTVTTIDWAAVTIVATVQWNTAVDFGSTHASGQAWTPFAQQVYTSGGRFTVKISGCSQRACGWRARSLP